MVLLVDEAEINKLWIISVIKRKKTNKQTKKPITYFHLRFIETSKLKFTEWKRTIAFS